MSTNTVVLRSIKGLSNLRIKFLVTFLFCELLLRCYDILEELRCSNTTSIYIIQALHCIWLRNWYGNSLTTTRLIYGPLELFCMLNLIDCTLEFSNLIDCLHSILYFSLLRVLTHLVALGLEKGYEAPLFCVALTKRKHI